MTTTSTPPPPPEKPWVWTSLGTAAMIVVCCGIAPVAIIAGIEHTRETSGSGKSGAVVAKASHRPPGQAISPQTPTLPASPTAMPEQAPLAPPIQDPPADEPRAYEPPIYGPPAYGPPAYGPPAYAAPAEQPPVFEAPREDPPTQPLPQAPPEVSVEPVPPADAPAAPPLEVTLPQPGQVARVGDTVRSGVLEYVVREVKCGLKQVGSDTRNQQAVGQFCVVTLSIKNIGQLTVDVLESAQKAIGANGLEYGAHALAGLAANEAGNQNWLSGIDPGEAVSGAVVFELPEGVDLAQVVLPGGIQVNTKP